MAIHFVFDYLTKANKELTSYVIYCISECVRKGHASSFALTGRFEQRNGHAVDILIQVNCITQCGTAAMYSLHTRMLLTLAYADPFLYYRQMPLLMVITMLSNGNNNVKCLFSSLSNSHDEAHCFFFFLIKNFLSWFITKPDVIRVTTKNEIVCGTTLSETFI